MIETSKSPGVPVRGQIMLCVGVAHGLLLYSGLCPDHRRTVERRPGSFSGCRAAQDRLLAGRAADA